MEEILDLDNQLCFRLYSISRKMTKAYEPFLEKYDLTYPQYVVMLALFKAEIVDFKDLSIEINLSPGTLTPLLKRLEELSYLERIKNPEDSRRMNVVLSKKGYELRENIVDVPLGMAEKLQLSIEKYTTLIKELDDLNLILDEINQQL
ncbi:MAG: MarR family transcriptional regulator [Candidatus Izemoplasmatales bacterium]|jgi:DNA-binding MarR family transcriptional regulator|nr:MarR family transcriptional regulator [Candidatus Izemoplasmatales bacterium]